MPRINCDVCGLRPARLLQRHTSRRLCGECFILDVRGRVSREVARWGMISPGDTVVLALSGGKDGFVLLDTLTAVHKPSKLIGVTVIEGIPGYNRREVYEALLKACRDRGVDLVLASMREYTGYSVAELMWRSRSRGLGHAPCTYCGIGRRRVINSYARMYGASRVATGHNLDDEAQTLIVNFLRGDVHGILRMHPLHQPNSASIVKRVKPLRKIYEYESAAYALMSGYPIQETDCPFLRYHPTLRSRAREALYQLELERPGTLISMMERLDEALEGLILGAKPVELPRCRVCGEPTSASRSICKYCELLSEAGIAFPPYSKAVARRNS